MKFKTLLVLAAVTLSWPAAAQELSSLKQKFSYAMGLQVGQSMARQGLAGDIDIDAFGAAIADILEGGELRLTQEEMQAAVTEMANNKRQGRLQAGQDFLAENGGKPNVVTLPSGLQYEELQAGDGVQPQQGDQVVLHYQGTLIDGTVFDSSYQRGEPATFPVGGLIPGFTEALLAMKTGAKWRVFIPSELGYGEAGAGDRIGPNEALIFEIELLSIN